MEKKSSGKKGHVAIGKRSTVYTWYKLSNASPSLDIKQSPFELTNRYFLYTRHWNKVHWHFKSYKNSAAIKQQESTDKTKNATSPSNIQAFTAGIRQKFITIYSRTHNYLKNVTEET